MTTTKAEDAEERAETAATVIQLCDAVKAAVLSVPGVVTCSVRLGPKPFSLDIAAGFGPTLAEQEPQP